MQVLAVEGAHFRFLLLQAIQQAKSLTARRITAVVLCIPDLDSMRQNRETFNYREHPARGMRDYRKAVVFVDMRNDLLRIFGTSERGAPVSQNVHATIARVLKAGQEEKTIGG